MHKTNPYSCCKGPGQTPGLFLFCQKKLVSLHLVMKKNLLTGLISSVLIVLSVASCQEDKPDIRIPVDPEPEREFVHIDNIGSTAPTVNEGDSLRIQLYTVPWDLLAREETAVSILRPDSSAYPYAAFSSMSMQADSTWNLYFRISWGIKKGDVVRIAVGLKDTVLYTPDLTLNYIKESKGIRTLSPDTVRFNEGDTAKIILRTIPWDMPLRDNVKISVLDGIDSTYRYATLLKPTMLPDTTWQFNLRMEYGMQSGDTVKLGISDLDTAMFSSPIVLMMIPKDGPTEQSVQRVSGPVSAYYTTTKARIVFRTTPWNLLMDDENNWAEVVDTAGNYVDYKFDATTPKFQPDSTWVIDISLTGDRTDEYFRIYVNTPDTTLESETINVKKVTFSLNTVQTQISGKYTKLEFDGDRTYTTLMPGTATDFAHVPLFFGHNADRIEISGQTITQNGGSFDIGHPLTVTLWKYDAHKDYTVMVRNTGLPVVKISTPMPVDTKDWVYQSMMEIYYADGTLNFKDTLNIRCRGNASYTDTQKKSYALKIDEKHKVLDMPKNKRWCLLANFKDRTLLRNDVTFWLSRKTSLDYTIRGRHVELFLNGQYRGNYYLCEQGKISKNRIPIADPDPTKPGESGYLIESDAYYSQESHPYPYGGFISGPMSIPYAFKEPDEDEMTQEAFNKVKKFINDFESCLMDEKRVKNGEYEKYIDVDQCIDYGLVQELTGNHDFYNDWPVPGTHSMYMHIDSIDYGGKLHFGHEWDFDYHTYQPSRQYGWVGMTTHGRSWSGQSQEFYYYYLLKDPEFRFRMQQRWNTLKDEFKKLPDYIDLMADSIRASESCNANMAGWFPIINPGGANDDERMSFDQAISEMKRGFLLRWEWIDQNIKNLGK